MKKKSLSIIFIFVVFCSLTFSGVAEANTSLDFAIHTEPNTAAHQAAEYFKEIVEEETDNEITVNLFPGAALGGEMDNIEQLAGGDVAFSIFGDILPSTLAEEVATTVVPFIYPSVEDVYEAWESEIGDMMNEKIEESGLMVIGLQKRGARHLTANRRIETPDELDGLRIRVPEIDTWVTVWEGIGASPTPVAWDEVYSALQTGVVEAQENPYENIYTPGLYEVQDYVMETGHLHNVFHWAVSLSVFEDLDEEHQDIILEAAERAAEYGSEITEDNIDEFKSAVQEEGMEVVEVDTELWISAAEPYVREIAEEEWLPEVWEHIEQYFD